NDPPTLNIELLPGEKSFLAVLAKGGGSEMSSRATMLPPGSGWVGVREFVLDVVDELGPYSCPPLVIGVGIGGGFDRAPFLAKKALLLPLDEPNPDEELSKRGREITEEVNTLGIGPAALGGTITCLGTKIIEAPCHMATLPIAVCLSCHSLRRKIVEI
ncbi:MAG: fumarate hydratase, partial [Actinomycetota bacterium]|nr:fumarate hydratase [Actinomycetota bacterium]